VGGVFEEAAHAERNAASIGGPVEIAEEPRAASLASIAPLALRPPTASPPPRVGSHLEPVSASDELQGALDVRNLGGLRFTALRDCAGPRAGRLGGLPTSLAVFLGMRRSVAWRPFKCHSPTLGQTPSGSRGVAVCARWLERRAQSRSRSTCWKRRRRWCRGLGGSRPLGDAARDRQRQQGVTRTPPA